MYNYSNLEIHQSRSREFILVWFLYYKDRVWGYSTPKASSFLLPVGLEKVLDSRRKGFSLHPVLSLLAARVFSLIACGVACLFLFGSSWSTLWREGTYLASPPFFLGARLCRLSGSSRDNGAFPMKLSLIWLLLKNSASNLIGSSEAWIACYLFHSTRCFPQISPPCLGFPCIGPGPTLLPLLFSCPWDPLGLAEALEFWWEPPTQFMGDGAHPETCFEFWSYTVPITFHFLCRARRIQYLKSRTKPWVELYRILLPLKTSSIRGSNSVSRI